MPKIYLRKNKVINRDNKNTVTGKPVNKVEFHPVVDTRKINESIRRLNESPEEDLDRDEEETEQFHDCLNPRLWDGMKLKEDVRQKLLQIANIFKETIKEKSIQFSDIIITGSNANYNWTNFSDIDLHLIYHYPRNGNQELVDDLLRTKAKHWKEKHKIFIKGVPIELTPQPFDDNLVAGGIYSLINNQWEKLPNKEVPTYNRVDIDAKVREFVSMIQDAVASGNLSELDEVHNKIHLLRQAGLEKGGEFSTENMAFKVLRNAGWIQMLKDSAHSFEDKELSLESLQESKRISPKLTAAIQWKGQSYTGGNKNTHLDVLTSNKKLPHWLIWDGSNRGYLDHNNKFLDRNQAHKYAVKYDLYKPEFKHLGNNKNLDLVAEFLKEEIEWGFIKEEEEKIYGTSPQKLKEISTNPEQLEIHSSTAHEEGINNLTQHDVSRMFSHHEKSAIPRWTTPEYRGINDYLRGQQSEHGSGRGYAQVAEDLQSAVRKHQLPAPVHAYRGVHGPQSEQINSMQPGKTFSYPGFMATTIDPQRATHFAKGNDLIHMVIPKGHSALYVSHPHLNSWEAEREMLLPHHSSFRYLGKEEIHMPQYHYSGDLRDATPKKMTLHHVEVLPNGE